MHIHPAPGHCGAGSWKALRAWHGTRHIRTPKCWFPSHPPVSQGEKPNQHGVVTGVGTDQGLPKKGQSQSGGRTPPLWQAAGAEPGRLERVFGVRGKGTAGEGNSRSKPRAAADVLQVARVEREWDGVEAELLSWAVEGLTGTTWHLTFTSEAQTGTARSGRLSLLLVRHPTFPSHRHPELPFGGPP